ncbi:hypothetical protein [Corynebacterium suranareeae]|uniref:hypothetical protein n=1 Tax=Corynebacterium suranareeae TaxID=2506452 RepID=UPI000BBB19BB|nr:hypothetical protein [Corynebacterium suranareeae]
MCIAAPWVICVVALVCTHSKIEESLEWLETQPASLKAWVKLVRKYLFAPLDRAWQRKTKPGDPEITFSTFVGLLVWYIDLNTKHRDPAFKFLKILGLLVWSHSNLSPYPEKSYLSRSAFNGFSRARAYKYPSKKTHVLKQAINAIAYFHAISF